MIKKVVVAPDNKKALAFFEAINKKKEEAKKKAEARMSKFEELLNKKESKYLHISGNR